MSTVRAEVEELVKAIVDPHDGSLPDDTAENYFNGMTSIRLIELIVGAENKFGIEFSNDDLVMGEEKNFDDFVEKIEKYVSEKTTGNT